MKNVYLFFVTFCFVSYTYAQSDSTTVSFSSFEISAGKGPVTSGLYGYINFENKKSLLVVTLSNNDNEITYLKKIGKKLLLGPNVGYFFNTPYISYQAIYQPANFVSLLSWTGVFFGDPRLEKIGSPKFGLSAQQINFYLGKFQPNYSLINYMDDKTIHVLALKYSQMIDKFFSVYTEAGYDFTNESQLLRFGLKYQK